MKLWEIKAESLRIMFADTDVEFSEEDFASKTIYDNANTREKLVRMDDSIRRAIDLFYQYNGELTRMESVSLVLEDGVYKNIINGSLISDFGYPTRIDVNQNLDAYIIKKENIPFMFDRVTKQIFIQEEDYAYYEDAITFTVYFKMAEQNLPFTIDEMSYDLDILHIPEKIQRQIPLYVKSELYEEDEPTLSKKSRTEYLEFLVLNQRKNYSKVNGKVKSKFPRGN